MLACLVVSVAGTPSLGAQAAVDPWGRVPPLTTNCYTGDEFDGKVVEAKQSVAAEIKRQDAVNDAVRQQMKDMPPGQLQQRMQEYMMKHPQEAMAAMQAMQSAGQASTEAGVTSNADRQKLDTELETHKAGFSAAVQKAQGPIKDKIATLINTKSKSCGKGDCWNFPDAADKAQYESLVKQVDTEYDKICPAWFGPKGTFQTWLTSYEAALVKQASTADDNEKAEIAQMKMLGASSGGYKSTATLDAVGSYLDKIMAVYQLRVGHAQAAPMVHRTSR
ncbi:MAG: hypothetical protein ABIQ49_14505 [Gemmatimonadales bacterium]